MSKTNWICEKCGSITVTEYSGFYGPTQYYICNQHRFGISIGIAMANIRRRRRNERSISRRGYGTRIYTKALTQLDNETLDRLNKEGKK